MCIKWHMNQLSIKRDELYILTVGPESLICSTRKEQYFSYLKQRVNCLTNMLTTHPARWTPIRADFSHHGGGPRESRGGPKPEQLLFCDCVAAQQKVCSRDDLTPCDMTAAQRSLPYAASWTEILTRMLHAGRRAHALCLAEAMLSSTTPSWTRPLTP